MPLRTPLPSDWARGLITWLVYTLSGTLAVSLSAPGGTVSPLFVAAGLGLALVMGWGPWMLAAVGMGAACVHLLALQPQLASMHWPAVAGMAAIGALGASLQAWVALRLLQGRGARHTPYSTMGLALETPADIARFLALAGPLACMVNATVSVSGLVALGFMPLSAAPQAWAGWWAGDTMGVLVGAPMMLTLVGQPRQLWRARRQQVGLPLLVATVLLSLSMRHLQSWQQEREAALFHHDVAATSNEVKLRLHSYLDALAALEGVFQASDVVTRSEFTRASRHWVSSLKGIRGIGWDERLDGADLPAFEARQQAEGVPGYRVYDGFERRPAAGKELVALRFVEPLQGNEQALGFNVLSTPVTQQAFELARREGKPTATRGFRLIQETGQQLGVVVYHPVYRHQAYTPQTRRQAALGAVFLALRMDDAVAAMLQGMPGYMGACLRDAGEGPHRLLGGSADCHAGRMGQGSLHRQTVPIEFAGRQWELVMWNTEPVPVLGQGSGTWLLAIGGVAFSAALGALLLVMTGHTRRLEAAMLEASAQKQAAEAANQAKSAFLSRMSHELRTPLNAVLGFAQVMALDQRDPLPPAQQQRVAQIQQAGWHLLDMIDDVLEISRLDAGTLPLHVQPLRIRHELAEAIALAQDEADHMGVQLVLPDQLPPEWGVKADAMRLRQILGQLLGNAIKFNRRGGKVTIKVTHEGGGPQGPTLAVSVQDNGLGMSPAQLAQLFQPFNRLGREQGPADGAGIGLVLSQHLAQLMGGQLSVQSQEGQGSTFTLSLPALRMVAPTPSASPSSAVAAVPARVLATAPAPARPGTPAESPDSGMPPAAATPAHQPRPRHVLYVEDNLANSEVVRSALAARPWITVSVAPTTEEGLAVLHDRLRGRQPDLILLDVHLPDASGQELLKLIKANPDTVSIPVIMISADALPEQIDAALAHGAACYLTKPVQLPELLRQVDALMPA